MIHGKNIEAIAAMLLLITSSVTQRHVVATDEQVQSAAEMASLFLTVPTVVLSAHVVCMWWKDAVEAFRSDHKTANHWFIMGVAIGFIGGVFDNIYWGVAWSLEFINSSYAPWWFRHGSIPNVFFRQLAGTIAAYCHVRAAYTFGNDKPVRDFNLWLKVQVMAGVLFIVFLMMLRGASQ